MQKAVKKIGILGGTFNPVHYGHLIVAEAVREDFRLDRVLFIPVGIPPHKSFNEVADARHRYNMVKCAIGSNPNFEASHLEIARLGLTYSIDTLTSLKVSYTEKTDFYFIIGADVVPELITWKDYTRVFKMCSFIAVLRPGNDGEALKLQIDELTKIHRANIVIARAPQIDISSTVIRERIMSGRTIKYLVPDCVENYILDNGLYKCANGDSKPV
ncbi:MAG: nicotinate-nucleotide adenylyltransferase [Ruminiclostridium sp.]|nr:nicotinate-nucleotide adenylyltransferase [Ruminiclostridium sp.]